MKKETLHNVASLVKLYKYTSKIQTLKVFDLFIGFTGHGVVGAVALSSHHPGRKLGRMVGKGIVSSSEFWIVSQQGLHRQNEFLPKSQPPSQVQTKLLHPFESVQTTRTVLVIQCSIVLSCQNQIFYVIALKRLRPILDSVYPLTGFIGLLIVSLHFALFTFTIGSKRPSVPNVFQGLACRFAR